MANLEAFILNNEQLASLEAHIGQFNIFEAVGVVRQELRHSDFLGYLLDPSGNHGLNDFLLKQVVMRVLATAETPPLSLIEIDVTDFNGTLVQREWRNIDLLITHHESDLVICIENKIGTSEHSNQLERYRTMIQNPFPRRRHIFIFLTPDGTLPSDAAYIPLSFETITEILDYTLYAK
ncbi:MAG: PD-(D/E)XK nuclease family protein, partial [Chloroflexota bacterium]